MPVVVDVAEAVQVDQQVDQAAVAAVLNYEQSLLVLVEQ